MLYFQLSYAVNPNRNGGRGQIESCDAKISEKCICSHHDETNVLTHISLFVTACQIPKFLCKIRIDNFLPIVG